MALAWRRSYRLAHSSESHLATPAWVSIVGILSKCNNTEERSYPSCQNCARSDIVYKSGYGSSVVIRVVFVPFLKTRKTIPVVRLELSHPPGDVDRRPFQSPGSHFFSISSVVCGRCCPDRADRQTLSQPCSVDQSYHDLDDRWDRIFPRFTSHLAAQDGDQLFSEAWCVSSN